MKNQEKCLFGTGLAKERYILSLIIGSIPSGKIFT